MASPKVLIIGLDGATWDLFAPWAECGPSAALAALMRRGTWGTLRSTVPALTLPAWSSFMTGKNPGGHGVYGFKRLPWNRYDGTGIANARDLRATTIWDVAAAAGKRVGVINVPPSYPIRPVPNGFVVGCMLTPPGQPFTDPPEVAGELGEYEIDLPPPKNLRRTDADYRPRALAYLEGMAPADATPWRGDACRIMAARPVDALCVVFYAPDRVQHYFWEYVDPKRQGPPPDEPAVRDAVLAVYAEMDRAVGRLLDAVGPDTAVIAFSDHGFGQKPERSVRINRWLADHGHLRRRPFWTARRRVVRKLFPRAVAHPLRHDGLHPRRPRAQPRVGGDHLHGDGGRVDQREGPLSERRRGAGRRVRARARRDPRRAREAAGRAGPSRLRERLAARRALPGPVRRRGARRRACSARRATASCSRASAGSSASRSSSASSKSSGTRAPTIRTGCTSSPAVRSRRSAGATRIPIEAIAPTTLYALDVPIPRDVEAPLMSATVDPDASRGASAGVQDPIAAEPTRRGPDWRSGEDEEQVADHLRALGYLE